MSLITDRISESIAVKQRILQDTELQKLIEGAANAIVASLKAGGKLVIGGNGGSESDSLHMAGEIVGRFQKERDPWPAYVLGSDITSLTAIANDYSYGEAYSREAKAFVKDQDVFLGISTSGNSENVLKAIKLVKKDTNAKVIALLGKDGGAIKEHADFPIIVPSNVTARIQESHIMIIHIICELVEDELTR